MIWSDVHVREFGVCDGVRVCECLCGCWSMRVCKCVSVSECEKELSEILLSVHSSTSKMLVSAKHQSTIFPNSIGAIFHKESSNTCYTNVIQAWSSSSSISSFFHQVLHRKVIHAEHNQTHLNSSNVSRSYEVKSFKY